MRVRFPAVSEPPRRKWLAASAPVLGVLVLGFALRLWGAAEHWAWFDRQHPQTWAESKLELSQDANQYIQQADPATWASPLHPWDVPEAYSPEGVHVCAPSTRGGARDIFRNAAIGPDSKPKPRPPSG
jgi:hypothetical protein